MKSSPVTVIVPCYNEEAGLPYLLQRLEAMRQTCAEDWCFLFIDDGSTDETFTHLMSATRGRPWLKVVRHNENLGLGAAIQTGFEHTDSAVICTIDSDCTYPPERLPELIAKVHDGADIVTASAWHPESAAAEGGKLRILLSRMVSAIYKLLIGQDVYTFTCLFRAYNRATVSRVRFRASGFAAVAEIMLRSMLSGMKVDEVAMQLESRRHGESKLKVSDAILAHLTLLAMTGMLVGIRNVRRAVATLTA